jgi:hypothetical protein
MVMLTDSTVSSDAPNQKIASRVRSAIKWALDQAQLQLTPYSWGIRHGLAGGNEESPEGRNVRLIVWISEDINMISQRIVGRMDGGPSGRSLESESATTTT